MLKIPQQRQRFRSPTPLRSPPCASTKNGFGPICCRAQTETSALARMFFSKKLLYDDMVATPLERLLEIGMADLHKNQAEFQRVAKEIDSGKPATEVLAELQSMRPAPGELMQTFRNTFDGLIAFINGRHIITLQATA